ncbi:hypothetical protein [Candidatus Xianfuyuplasma coldseepsis]|uniref:Uncharacterized protein n=1 Tax=Candidatus Xianfuyuplasma coldseepsis TaxID=2782163 RepID=A0A7L7KRJ9_9MOLU|nr:hypothetical protein [Xianfuyuplasma coldseepsis]QMS85337.1 hypothetical protein G4Z02_06075 [Xianfuyuplasma coldseepsis]
MGNNFLGKLRQVFGARDFNKENDQLLHTISVQAMDARYEFGDMIGAANVLRMLLEMYGERKKQNHRQKGRKFIEFILSSKHQDLKNVGYKHWQNINKLIHLNQPKVYPYHQKNLEQAIAFFKKEVKGIHQINIQSTEEI